MAADEVPDEETMARVAGCRSDLLETLVRRYAVRLLTFICRFVGDRHRGEELFQDVFLAVWSKRHQYQHPRPTPCLSCRSCGANACPPQTDNTLAFRIRP